MGERVYTVCQNVNNAGRQYSSSLSILQDLMDQNISTKFRVEEAKRKEKRKDSFLHIIHNRCRDSNQYLVRASFNTIQGFGACDLAFGTGVGRLARENINIHVEVVVESCNPPVFRQLNLFDSVFININYF